MSLFSSSSLPCSFFLLCSGGRWLKSSGPEPWESKRGAEKRNKNGKEVERRENKMKKSNFHNSLFVVLLFQQGYFLVRCSISFCCKACGPRLWDKWITAPQMELLLCSNQIIHLEEILQPLSNTLTESRDVCLCIDLRPFTYSVAVPDLVLSGNASEM